MIRYIKNKTSGKIIVTQDAETCTDESMMKDALSSGLIEGEVEINIANKDTINEWVETQHQEEQASLSYAHKRKGSYPPMEDYLDGIVKGDQTQIDKYISDCLAIKEKYPKE